MAKSFYQIVKGLLLRGESTDPTDNKEGSFWVNSVSSRLKGYLQGAVRTVVTEDQTQTLTNKTLTSPTVGDFTNAQHNHSNAAGGGLVDHTVLTSIGTNTHAQIDTHIAGSTGVHGVTGAVVGTTDTQTLTNKTIDGDNNTVQDLDLTSLKTVPADANKLIVRDGSGVVVSSSSLPSGLSGSFLDNAFTLQDNIDPTKQLQFQASGITAGQTRTLTSPDANTTIVGTDATQILTNKTIDATNNTISNIANANIATGAGIALNKLTTIGNGNIIVGNGSGIPTDTAMSGAITISNAGITAYNGTVPINKGGTGATTQTDGFDALAPNTTKGDLIVYNGTDNIRVGVGSNDQVLTADSAAASGIKWADAGSGGSGRVNFLSGNNTNFKNSIGSWVAFKDAAATTPADLTGGSPTVISIARGTAFDSTGNARISHTAANGQGEGASCLFDITVEPEYRSSAMDIEFNYVTSSGYADDKLELWIYDVTNSTLIQPSAFQLKASLSPAKFKAQFQTSSTGSSYRVGFFCGNTTATAYDVDFDNIVVGPSIYNYGLVGTDWVAFTATLTGSSSNPTRGTVTYETGFWRRIGSDLEITYSYNQTSAGSSGSGSYYFSLPSGLTIDSAKLKTPDGSNTAPYVGSGDMDGDPGSFTIDVIANSTTRFGFQLTNATTSGANWSSSQASFANANMRISWNAKVPILGWATNVQMSDSADLRQVLARATGLTNGTIANNGTAVLLPATKTYDTHGVLDISTGIYTVAMPGYYRVRGGVITSSVAASAINKSLDIFVTQNGSAKLSASDRVDTTTSRIYSVDVEDVLLCAAGDTLKITISNQIGATITPSNDANYSFISVEKVQGPSSIGARELVAASYGCPSGQTHSNNTVTIVNFSTKNFDTHNSVTTGASWKFTAPVSGTYRVNARGQYTDSAANYTCNFDLYKNGGKVYSLSRVTTKMVDTDSKDVCFGGSGLLQLVAGDTLDVRADQASGGSLAFANDGVSTSFIDIERVGF